MTAASISGKNIAFEIECSDFFAEAMQVFGVPKSVGQIYGLLYASPRPLSFSGIVERLEISKGSASQGLQFLRSLGAINVADATFSGAKAPFKVSGVRFKASASSLHLAPSQVTPGSDSDATRRVAYEPELSLRKLVSGVLQERIAPLATTGGSRLARLRELADGDGEESDFYLDRVRQLETWRRRFKTVLPVLNALLGPKSRK